MRLIGYKPHRFGFNMESTKVTYICFEIMNLLSLGDDLRKFSKFCILISDFLSQK